MTLDLLESRFHLETPRASAFVVADAALKVLGGFSFQGFALVGLVTEIPEKVPSTLVASSCGFQSTWVGLVEIGTVGLETATAFQLDLATMLSHLIVPFETVSVDVTFAEKPLESGDDIIMTFLVQQDELFVWVGGTKPCDVEGAVGIHQEDLVVKEGRR